MAELHALTTDQARRIADMLAAYERGELRTSVPQRRRTADDFRVLLGKADATINGTTQSTSGPGSGTVSVWSWGSTGNLLDMGWNVTAYNFSTTAVTTGRWLQLKMDAVSGRYLIDFEACT